MTIPPAPSAAPNPVSVSAVTSSTITVQWGPVECIHRNGDITGYSVRYRVAPDGPTQDMTVSDNEVTIMNLMSSTTYSIQVRAVNGDLLGPFSDVQEHLTAGMRSEC